MELRRVLACLFPTYLPYLYHYNPWVVFFSIHFLRVHHTNSWISHLLWYPFIGLDRTYHLGVQTRQDQTGPDRIRQDQTGQDRTGPDRTGKDLDLLDIPSRTRLNQYLHFFNNFSVDHPVSTWRHWGKRYYYQVYLHTWLFPIGILEAPVIPKNCAMNSSIFPESRLI